MGKVKILTLVNLFLLVLILAVVIQMSERPTERALADAPDEVVARVDMNAEAVPDETPMPRPTPTICCYEWTPAEIETTARAFYGLNTSAEKFGFAGVAVNRFMCRQMRLDGKLIFGNGTFISVITQSREFEFYNRKAPVTKENRELAEFYMNVHMTHYLTKSYTGFIFPTNALYFGWDVNGVPVVKSSIEAEPFYYSGKEKLS